MANGGREGGLPRWMLPLATAATDVRLEQLSRFGPPAGGGRDSAVLLLFGDGGSRSSPRPDLLLIERSAGLRSHAGQPAFPGGAVDSGDRGPVDAALREASEETGLDPAGVVVVATLPTLWVPPSGYLVTPVLGWWRDPSPVRVLDPGEVAAVHRVSLDDLLEPANRFQVRHPSGYIGPAFRVAGMLVWGFTAGLLATLLRLAGMERPWDTTRVRDLPPDLFALARRSAAGTGDEGLAP